MSKKINPCAYQVHSIQIKNKFEQIPCINQYVIRKEHLGIKYYFTSAVDWMPL